MVKSTTITTIKDGKPEQRVMAVGKRYLIAHDARLKHYRGRICTITDFNSLLPSRVRIVFDNGQRGATRVEDLGVEILEQELLAG